LRIRRLFLAPPPNRSYGSGRRCPTPAGRPRTPLPLTDDEKAKLAAWSRRPRSAQRLALRAKIVLAAADGRSNTAIAADLRVRRGVFKSVRELERAIEAYLAERNAGPKPFRWTATADLILRRVDDICKRTLNSGH
jgi:hypothetical protein